MGASTFYWVVGLLLLVLGGLLVVGGSETDSDLFGIGFLVMALGQVLVLVGVIATGVRIGMNDHVVDELKASAAAR